MSDRVTHVAVAALVLFAIPATSATHRSGTERPLKLIAQRASTTLGSTIPVALTTFVMAGPLLDPVSLTKLGDGKTVCSITDVRLSVIPPEANADCRSIYTMGTAGEIHLSSSRVYQADFHGIHYHETRLAITGGTGEYRTVRGDATGTFQKSAGRIAYLIDMRLTVD